MQNLLQDRSCFQRSRRRAARRCLSPLLAVLGLLLFSAILSNAQSTGDTTPNALELGPRCPTCPIVIAAGSLSMKDREERTDRANQNAQKKNFNAANAARKLHIDDETNRMLILARDLKAKIDGLGSERPSAMMLREAAVIEFLAKDIKEKMKLTVNPD